MAEDPKSPVSSGIISQVPVRVTAEMGRISRSLQEALNMKPGEVIDLEQAPEDPVSVYVDGVKYAIGKLTVVDGQWAVKLDKIIAKPSAPIKPPQAPVEESTGEENLEEVE